jgi:hypothetical protein
MRTSCSPPILAPATPCTRTWILLCIHPVVRQARTLRVGELELGQETIFIRVSRKKSNNNSAEAREQQHKPSEKCYELKHKALDV